MPRKRDFFHTGLNVSRSDLAQMFNFMYGAYAGGKVYHVKKVDDTNYNDWHDRMYVKYYDGSESIQTSIEAAIAAADDFDTILVHPGQWLPAATLAITQDSLKLLAVEQGPYGRCLTRTEIRQYGNVDTPVISVEGAHNVEIAGFRITPYDPGTLSAGINVGQIAASYGVFIHNNYFYGVGSGATGPCHIRLGVDASFDCDSAYIWRNDFYCGGASNDSIGQIEWNSATRAQIRDNMFWTQGNVATAFAINIYDAAAFRGGILDNRFVNIEVGLTGSNAIAINNPVAVGGDGIIDGNSFVNYAAEANCLASEVDTTIGLNYLNGTLINV